MNRKPYATKKEVEALIKELVERNTAGLKQGRMCEPFNFSHLDGEMKRRGMSYPENLIEHIEWINSMDIPKFCRKMAMNGHWFKGAMHLIKNKPYPVSL